MAFANFETEDGMKVRINPRLIVDLVEVSPDETEIRTIADPNGHGRIYSIPIKDAMKEILKADHQA